MFSNLSAINSATTGLRGSGGAVRSKEVAEGVRGGREGFAGETEADRPGLIRGSNLESLPGAGGEVMMINRVISRDEPGLRTHSAANHGTTMLDARIRPHHQQMQQQQTKKKSSSGFESRFFLFWFGFVFLLLGFPQLIFFLRSSFKSRPPISLYNICI